MRPRCAMAPNLPGFYFDETKGKYFKITNGSHQPHSDRYHNNTVQAEKRRARHDKVTKRRRSPAPRANDKVARLQAALVRAHHARALRSWRFDADDAVALKLGTPLNVGDAAMANVVTNFKRLESAPCQCDWAEEVPEGYSSATVGGSSGAADGTNDNTELYSRYCEPRSELVLLGNGLESIAYEGTLTSLLTAALLRFVAALDNVRWGTRTRAYFRNSLRMMRLSTYHFTSPEGSVSVVMLEQFEVRDRIYWSEDLSRRLWLDRNERKRVLLGWDWIGEAPGDDRIDAVRFEVKPQPPCDPRYADYHVTALCMLNTTIYLGTSLGEVLEQQSSHTAYAGGLFINKYFDRAVVVAVCAGFDTNNVSDKRAVFADAAGVMMVRDSIGHECYAHHGSTVTNVMMYAQFFVAVGLRLVARYDYRGQRQLRYDYYNDNTVHQVLLRHNGSSGLYVLVTESPWALRLISVHTAQTRRLALGPPQRRWSLTTMAVNRGTLEVYYHAPAAVRVTYRFDLP